jgi:hypothetical protein
MQVVGCEEGPSLPQAGQTVFFCDPDNTVGRVNVTTVLLGDDPGVSGCNTLAYLTFEIIDWDVLPTSLCFENLVMQDHYGGQIFAVTECGAMMESRKGDVDTSNYVDYVDLFDFAFEWHLRCEDGGYCAIKDYNNDCYIDYVDLFEFVFDWHTGVHITSPDGGEVCSGMEEVMWEAGALGGEDLLIDVYVTTDEGACWHQIATDEPDDGNFIWDTTAWPDSDRCKLKAMAHNSTETYEDESDALFTVNNSGGGAKLSGVESEANIESAAPTIKALKIRTKVIRKTRQGAQVEVLIEAKKAEDLHNISFDLEFDPETVKVLACEEGEFLKQAGETVFLPDVDNEEGKVNVGTALLGKDRGASGSGTVAKLTVVVKKGKKLPPDLFLNNVVLQNSQGGTIQ